MTRTAFSLRAIALLIALSAALTLGGCASPLAVSAPRAPGAEASAQTSAPTSAQASASEPTLNEGYSYPMFDRPSKGTHVSALPFTPDEAHTDLIMDGTRMQFVTDAEKESWRAPLVKLLSNVLLPVVDREVQEIVGYVPSTDPNAPAVEDAFACALFDVTMDGTPELLVYPYGGGGSSGNSYYFVYDILTGTRLGSISCSAGENFSVYYRPADGRLYSLARFYLRGGYFANSRTLASIVTYEDKGYSLTSNEAELWHYHSENYLYACFVHDNYSVDENGKLSEYREDAYEYVLLPTEEEYRVQGIPVDAETYYGEMRMFTESFLRIPQTTFRPVVWGDVIQESEEENYPLRGEKMADALLALDQEFLRYAAE